ncbi:MAG: hypothetical protein WB036_29860, partial [Pseudolabrys sp.]
MRSAIAALFSDDFPLFATSLRKFAGAISNSFSLTKWLAAFAALFGARMTAIGSPVVVVSHWLFSGFGVCVQSYFGEGVR